MTEILIKWIKSLFEPNPNKCKHEYGKWSLYGAGRYFQRRTCKHCGYTQEEML